MTSGHRMRTIFSSRPDYHLENHGTVVKVIFDFSRNVESDREREVEADETLISQK